MSNHPILIVLGVLAILSIVAVILMAHLISSRRAGRPTFKLAVAFGGVCWLAGLIIGMFYQMMTGL